MEFVHRLRFHVLLHYYSIFIHLSSVGVGQDSVVGTATCYALDGPAIDSRLGRDILHPSIPTLVLNRPPVQCVAGPFPRGKTAGS